jgi:hypothetical protein
MTSGAIVRAGQDIDLFERVCPSGVAWCGAADIGTSWTSGLVYFLGNWVELNVDEFSADGSSGLVHPQPGGGRSDPRTALEMELDFPLEVSFRWRLVSVDGGNTRIGFRLNLMTAPYTSGPGAGEWSHAVLIDADSGGLHGLRAWENNNDNTTDYPYQAVDDAPWSPYTWNNVAFLADGQGIWAKAWQDGADEPDDWQVWMYGTPGEWTSMSDYSPIWLYLIFDNYGYTLEFDEFRAGGSETIWGR